MEYDDPNKQAAIEDAIRRMEWEGAYIGQEQGVVKNSQFPERAGRIRFLSGRPDRSLFNSANGMNAVIDRKIEE